MHTHQVRPDERDVLNLLDESRRSGPVRVRRDDESYVLVSEAEWTRLTAAVPTFAELLKACPVHEDDLPERQAPRAFREGLFD